MSFKRSTTPDILPAGPVRGNPVEAGLKGWNRSGGTGTWRLKRKLVIRVESPATDDARKLIADSQRALLRYLPADEIFSLDAEALQAPNVTFFVARLNGEPMGCVALLDDTRYGEVKRLYVRDAARGLGLAQALMAEVEAYCRDIGLLDIKLETSPVLQDAVRLYRALGYAPCDAFGDYPLLESSLFMSKSLGSLRPCASA